MQGSAGMPVLRESHVRDKIGEYIMLLDVYYYRHLVSNTANGEQDDAA
jgi:hypothetical protein